MTGPSLYGTRCNAVCDHKHKNLDCVHPRSAGSGDELSWLAHIVNATYLSSRWWSFMYGFINSRLLDRNCLCWENSTSWIYLPRLGGRLSALDTSYFLFNEASLEKNQRYIIGVGDISLFHWIYSPLNTQRVREGVSARYLCWSTPPPAGSCTALCSSSWEGCTPPGTGRRLRSSPRRTRISHSRSSRGLKGNTHTHTHHVVFVRG